jgi:MFS transporter, DHA2 family, lincomycin resistance protein
VVLAGVLWAFTTLSAASALWMIIAMHVVLVIGLSLMFTPLMTDALGQLPKELDSHGSAIMATLQQVAGAAGAALFVTVMTLASAGATHGIDMVSARAAFLCAAVIATVAFPVSLLIGRRATADQCPGATATGAPPAHRVRRPR